MPDPEKHQQLNDQWERAVERAEYDKRTQSELDPDTLNDAAGLHVQSGVKSGWTSSCYCSDTCAPCI